MNALGLARSFLFVPGDDERKLEKAPYTGADAVIVDLEDAVAPERKEGARALLKRAISWSSPPLRLVRVNSGSAQDLEAAAAVGLDALVLPKATEASVSALSPGGLPVVALLESAAGLRDAYAIAEHPRVVALMLGALDLTAELGLRAHGDGQELLHVRSLLVLASAAAGIRRPVDSVSVTLDDKPQLLQDARRARDLGFGGKACIHPQQLQVVHDAFAPACEDIEWARKVVAAFTTATKDGRGAIAVDGQLVDKPVFTRARDLLNLATRRTT